MNKVNIVIKYIKKNQLKTVILLIISSYINYITSGFIYYKNFTFIKVNYLLTIGILLLGFSGFLIFEYTASKKNSDYFYIFYLFYKISIYLNIILFIFFIIFNMSFIFFVKDDFSFDSLSLLVFLYPGLIVSGIKYYE